MVFLEGLVAADNRTSGQSARGLIPPRSSVMRVRTASGSARGAADRTMGSRRLDPTLADRACRLPFGQCYGGILPLPKGNELPEPTGQPLLPLGVGFTPWRTARSV